MKLDWLQIALLSFAIWILFQRSKDDKHIDWVELAATAVVVQVVAMLWQEV